MGRIPQRQGKRTSLFYIGNMFSLFRRILPQKRYNRTPTAPLTPHSVLAVCFVHCQLTYDTACGVASSDRYCANEFNLDKFRADIDSVLANAGCATSTLIVLDQLSRISQLYTTPHAPYFVLYLGPGTLSSA